MVSSKDPEKRTLEIHEWGDPWIVGTCDGDNDWCPKAPPFFRPFEAVNACFTRRDCRKSSLPSSRMDTIDAKASSLGFYTSGDRRPLQIIPSQPPDAKRWPICIMGHWSSGSPPCLKFHAPLFLEILIRTDIRYADEGGNQSTKS